MSLMFSEFLEPIFKTYDAHEWRKKKLWVEEVDYALKVGLPVLKEVYKKHTGKISMPGAPKFMCCYEFEDLIVNANCLNEKFGSNQLCIMYNLAMMTQLDEIESERHINMTFVEFLEAFVRVAEKLEIPNLEDDPETFIGMELTTEQKETYAERPLNQKVDSLILYVGKTYLKKADYNAHCK